MALPAPAFQQIAFAIEHQHGRHPLSESEVMLGPCSSTA